MPVIIRFFVGCVFRLIVALQPLSRRQRSLLQPQRIVLYRDVFFDAAQLLLKQVPGMSKDTIYAFTYYLYFSLPSVFHVSENYV